MVTTVRSGVRMRVERRPISSTTPVRPSRKRQRSPDAHRLVGDDADAAEHVLDRLLRGERDRDAADAEPGDEAGDVEADVLEQQHDGEQREEDLAGAAAERHQGGGAPASLALEPLLEPVGADVDQAQGGP